MRKVNWIILLLIGILMGAVILLGIELNNETQVLEHYREVLANQTIQIKTLRYTVATLNESIAATNQDVALKYSTLNQSIMTLRNNYTDYRETTNANIELLARAILNLSYAMNNTLSLVEYNANRIAILNHNIEVLHTELTALNKTVYDYIVPPYNYTQLYDNGTIALFQMDMLPLIKQSPLVTPNVEVLPVDMFYIIPTVDKINELEEIMNWTGIPGSPYIFEIHDCDDYAWSMYAEMKMLYMGISFGVAYTKYHAFNVIFLKDKDGSIKMYIVEPQLGIVMTQQEAKDFTLNGTKIYDGIIAIFI